MCKLVFFYFVVCMQLTGGNQYTQLTFLLLETLHLAPFYMALDVRKYYISAPGGLTARTIRKLKLITPR